VIGRSDLPTGTVTLLFTDIEGSTVLLERLGDAYGEVLALHHATLREVWNAHRGVEVKTDGDAFFVAFQSATDAVAAARAGQEALAPAPWPEGVELRVRMGLHTGEPRVRDDDYWGSDVHYAARVASAANGGQVLLSETTAAIVPDVALTDLGRHRLKDFGEPRRLFAFGTGEQRPPRSLDPLRTNLPSVRAPLHGRDRELEELVARLAGDSRLVTLTGAGGNGKTRLALAVAENLLDRLVDGAFLVELAEISRPEDVPAAIAHAVGAQLTGEDPAGALATALSRRDLLLVLDNFEHLLVTAPMLARLIAEAPDVRLLVTSQAPLRLADEEVVVVEPLAVPERDDLGALGESPAAEMLVERARRAAPGFQPTEQNAPSIARLCRALDGSPLALQLAAARLAVLDPASLLERLEGTPDAIGRGGRDLPERQRGLRATLEWTYGLLDRDAAKLFRRVGIFASDATLERIEQVCGDDDADVLEALATLVEFSLVRRREDGRFGMPTTLRSYARELLEESGDLLALRERHARVVADELWPFALRHPIDRYGAEAAAGAEAHELPTLLAWAADHDVEVFASLIGAAVSRLAESSELPGLRPTLERALDSGIEDPLVRAVLLFALASADDPGAQPDFSQAIKAAHEGGDRVLAAGLTSVEILYEAQWFTEFGPEWLEQTRATLDEFATDSDPAIQALGRETDGFWYYAAGRYEEAAAAIDQSAEPTTWPGQVGLYILGDSWLEVGRFVDAWSSYVRAARHALLHRNLTTLTFQIEGAAAALAGLGRYEEAVRTLGFADTINPTERPLREVYPSWGRAVAAQTDPARAAIGDKAADAAYAEGRALPRNKAIEAFFAIPVDAAVT
jgi:predicted ATPase/class 3 adenylate cyclase